MTCAVSRLKIKHGSRKNSFMCFPDALATVFSRVTIWRKDSDAVIRSIAHFLAFGAKPNKKCDIEMKNKEEFLETDRSVLVVRDYLAKGL